MRVLRMQGMRRARWERSRRARLARSAIPLRPIIATCGVVLLASTALIWGSSIEPPYQTVAGPGHGRGMSQVGAFENAKNGWTAERILDFYYPGATLGTIAPTTLAVRLTAQDNSTLDTYAPAGARVADQILEPGQVAHLTPLPDGGANVVVTVGCDGAVLWQAVTDEPWVYPIDPGPGRPAAEHLTLCGGTSYRGALGVTMENGEARTVNNVDVEDYLLGVVPAEMQANWADKGAVEALRAQAIAARSYALAEQRYPYAQTCDTTDCQVYPGTVTEDPRAASAVASTAGTVLLRDGHILRSEYSAAPDGGQPADIQTFEVGPTPADLVPSPPSGPTGPTPDQRKQAATTESLIDIEYRRLGGPDSNIGEPIGPEMILPQDAGTYRMFSNGVIVATPTLGIQVVDFTTLMELIPDTFSADGEPTSPGATEGTEGAEGTASSSEGPDAPQNPVEPVDGAPLPQGAAAPPDIAVPPASKPPLEFPSLADF